MKQNKDNYYEEIPKHKKKTKSNTSKSKVKSKHKHQYEECLLQYDSTFTYTNKTVRMTSLASYCTVCGKIGDKLKDDKSIVKDYYQIINSPFGKVTTCISDEELYEKYKDKLPVFFLEDITNRYVSIENKNREYIKED